MSAKMLYSVILMASAFLPAVVYAQQFFATPTAESVPYGKYFRVDVKAAFDEVATFEITHFGSFTANSWSGHDYFPCDVFGGTKQIEFELKQAGVVLIKKKVSVKCVMETGKLCNITVDIPEKVPFGDDFEVKFKMTKSQPRDTMYVKQPGRGDAAATDKVSIKLKCDKVKKLVPIKVYLSTQGITTKGDFEKCLDETRKVCCYKDANTKCDPHFTTFSGEKYDYHGECDLVVLHNPKYKNGLGMYVHVRTKIETFYSYIHTAVLQIGQETFEVTGAPYNQVWLNGIPGVEFPARISGHAIGHRQIGEHQHRYNIILGQGNGEHIEISTYKHFVGVSVKQATSESFNGSMGLLGSFETGHKVARDGSTIINHPNDFGQEWQVLPTDPHLFRNLEGPQSPEKCLLPTISSKESRNLRADGISLEHAHAACARVSSDEYDNCVFDVLATNDIGIAGAY